VQEVLWRHAGDTTIWSHAREHGFVVVTKDRDYLELSREMGHPPKVILIRTGNSPAAVVESLLRDHYDEILAFGQDPDRGIIELH
jgi:predicted nuclease of predicted toxin-antitoxin system